MPKRPVYASMNFPAGPEIFILVSAYPAVEPAHENLDCLVVH